MTASSPWRRLLAIAVVGAALTVFVSACGDDSGGSGATTAGSEQAPEDVIVPDSQVTAGLAQTKTDMQSLADGVAAGTATTDDYETVFTAWTTYEGTVKQNDVEAYLALEDALAGMQKAITDKDVEAATAALDAFGAAADAYLAEHP